jgi:hypothetical protein
MPAGHGPIGTAFFLPLSFSLADSAFFFSMERHFPPAKQQKAEKKGIPFLSRQRQRPKKASSV